MQKKTPIIKLAYDELDKFHWSEKDLVAYEERVMDLQKEAAIIAYQMETAEQKGREKSKKTREIEIAKNLLKVGVSVDLIAESTGLSIDEIEKLRLN